ncbi:MAG: hypothetical protein ACFB10_05805 [Salibacteraceae bacterium]
MKVNFLLSVVLLILLEICFSCHSDEIHKVYPERFPQPFNGENVTPTILKSNYGFREHKRSFQPNQHQSDSIDTLVYLSNGNNEVCFYNNADKALLQSIVFMEPGTALWDSLAIGSPMDAFKANLETTIHENTQIVGPDGGFSWELFFQRGHLSKAIYWVHLD